VLTALAALVILALAGAMYRSARARGARPRFGSIAVLPFANLGSDPTADYLADGLTESTIADVAPLPGLRVISRTSSMYFKRVSKPLAEIARQLKVDAVVEGSVRMTPQRVQIDTRLVDASTDSTLWSIEREGGVEELVSVRRQISEALARQLGYPPSSHGREPTSTAYRLYLQGLYEWNKRTPADLRAARDRFEAALRDDPMFVDAQAMLAQSYLLGAFDAVPKSEVFPKADAMARRALQADIDNAAAHATLGYLRYDAGDTAGGQGELRRALSLNPNDATTRQWYALTMLGRPADHPEALRQMEIAYSIDPLSQSIGSDLGLVYRRLDRFPDAARQLSATLDIYPDFADGHKQLALVYEQQGKYADAARETQRAVNLGAQTPENLSMLGLYQARSGDAAAARMTVRRLEEPGRHSPPSPVFAATVHAALGDRDQAIRLLVAATHDASHAYLDEFVQRIDRRFPELASDPRVRTIIAEYDARTGGLRQ